MQVIWKKVLIPGNQTILNKNICNAQIASIYYESSEIWNFAFILLDMSIVTMQEFVFLWYVFDLQMTFGNVWGEVMVLREWEFWIFCNHVLCIPERWYHMNVYSHYEYNQPLKLSLLVKWRSDKVHKLFNRHTCGRQ